MDIQGSQNIRGAQGINPVQQTSSVRRNASSEISSRVDIRDQVDISSTAKNLGETQSITSASDQPIRFELINRVRAEIAAGTYETPEKLDIALERLLSGIR